MRKLGNRFVIELKKHFGTEKNIIGPVIFAFKSALAEPTNTLAIGQFNPLSNKDIQKKRSISQGWTNREIDSKIAETKLIFASKDRNSCD